MTSGHPDPVPDDVPTWDEIARDHVGFMYSVAFRLAGNQSDAEDVVQDALVRVKRGLESYTPGSLHGWLARIVTNVFLDETRRRKRRPQTALPDDPDVWFQLGRTYNKQDSVAEAIDALERAVEFSPNMTDAWFFLGIAYDKRGDTSQASRAYREARRLGREQAGYR